MYIQKMIIIDNEEHLTYKKVRVQRVQDDIFYHEVFILIQFQPYLLKLIESKEIKSVLLTYSLN